MATQHILACIDGSAVTESICGYAAWYANRLSLPVALLNTIEVPASVRRDLSGTIGVDRFFVVDGHDVSIQWEYQRDGLGAAVSEDYLRLLYSRAFQRGEFQVFGRDETALSGSFMINPLWTVAGLSLWNLNDGSMLVAPTVAYSAGDETAISAGLYFGFGDDEVSSTRPLPSEYGLNGITGFLSVSWFF